jgi:hypothetical protein
MCDRVSSGYKTAVFLARALAVALVCSTPSIALAQDGLRLEYLDETGASNCPSEEGFREIVAARVGRAPFDDQGSRLVRVVLRRAGRDVHIRVELLAPDGELLGERTIDGSLARCDDAAESAALAVAVAADPLGGAAPIESPPVVVEPTEPPPVAPPPLVEPIEPSAPIEPIEPIEPSAPIEPIEPIEPPPVTAEAIHVHLGAWADVRFLRAPGPMLGGTLTGAVRGDVWSVLLGASLSSTITDQVDGGERISNGIYGGSAGACAHYDVGFACGSLLLGVYQSNSSTVARPMTLTSFYAEIDVSVGVEWFFVPWLALRASGELGIPLVRIELAIDGRALHTISPVSLGLTLGLVARLL